ncbi:MAG TPA: hypothetical protein VNE17_00410, partial [Nitrolancea sp.]|nr:hypothetical protein [Nitrolancea sp.]
SKRPHAAGMPIPPPSSGLASATSDANGVGNVTTPSAGPVPAPADPSSSARPSSINGAVHAK